MNEHPEYFPARDLERVAPSCFGGAVEADGDGNTAGNGGNGGGVPADRKAQLKTLLGAVVDLL